MTTTISIILVASWAFLFGVDYLNAKAVTFPGAQTSALLQQQSLSSAPPRPTNQQEQGSDCCEAVRKVGAEAGGAGQGGHPSAPPRTPSAHPLRTRQASYTDSQDYEDASTPALGVIGCKFSKSLCDQKLEWCFDDYAFGRCLKIYEPPEPSQLYRYELSREDTHSLEEEMERLYSLGYRWAHVYTQCVLQSSLDAIRLGRKWDVSGCSLAADADLEGAMGAFQDDVEPLNLAFVKFTPSQSDPHPNFADELYRPPLLTPIQTSAVSSPIYEKLGAPLLPKGSGKPSSTKAAASSPALNFKLEGGAGEGDRNDLRSQLKALPPRQHLEVSPEGLEELLLEEAIAEYLERSAGRGKGKTRTEKRTYPYYSPHREPIQFRDGPGEESEEAARKPRLGSDEDRPLPSHIQEAEEEEKALEEEIQAQILLRALAEAAEASSLDDRSKDLWQDSPQEARPELPQRAEREEQEEEDKEEEHEGEAVDSPSETRPRIFSAFYNTPDLFRHGMESKDTESAMFAAALEDAAAEEGMEEPEKGYKMVRDGLEENYYRRDGEGLPLEDFPVALPLLDGLGEEASGWADGRGGRLVRVGEEGREGREGELEPDLRVEGKGLERAEGLPRESELEEKPLYTEGGVMYLNRNPKRRFLLEFEGSGGRRNSGFERRERLDVKKPGPWYRQVNNFAFDYEEKMRNPEFGANEGPADMLSPADVDMDYHTLRRNEVGRERDSGSSDALETEKEEEDGADEGVRANKKSAPAFLGSPPLDNIEIVDKSEVKVVVEEKLNYETSKDLLNTVAQELDMRPSSFSAMTFNGSNMRFRVEWNERGLNASEVAQAIGSTMMKSKIASDVGLHVISAQGSGRHSEGPFVGMLSSNGSNRFVVMTFFLALLVVSLIVGALTLYLIRRQAKQQEKLARLAGDDAGLESCKDYQDLCRARMASKSNEKVEPIKAVQRVASTISRGSEDGNASSRSSTSSWSEEPVLTNMDISTGHMVLSYMEDHLKNKDRLEQEWGALCAYEADPNATTIAEKTDNMKKNRFTNSLPYDHSRVILNDLANVSGSDYINASTITDHDPRNPAYIATQGPMANTCADFWQMVWEQGSVVIVTLTRLADNGTPLCHRYWPDEGSELHHIYEVHLVSEHIWCDEYLVRSFYLKNLKTGETRTVTQFHFLAWPENSIPSSTKAILEFRRKVNKSYRGRSCPIIVHCSDGAGRTGTYCLIDMVLNRMGKGAKEIDIAASLEHIRDQRPGMVRTKQQFEFVLMAVAEEVHAILKALPQ